MKNSESNFALICKIIFGFFLIYTSATLYTNATQWVFMNSVNLIFHEAGHVIFMLFGRFIYMLGGTLMEIGVPLAVTAHFFIKKEFFATSFGFWWLSISLWSVSVYASDAELQLLPLLGGESSIHDWNYVLGELHILNHAHTVGNIFFTLSLLSFIFFLLYMYFDILSRYKQNSCISET